PNIDGTMIRVAVPPLSQERREELVKLLHQKLEAGRIMVRQARHEDLKEIEGAVTAEDEKERLEKELQENVDETMAIIENLGKAKEEELLTI
ncbi:MAG: ribosome-recycling factor, partial [bacterium]|nr:ribosome-recycling factor [bacterium]